MDLPFGDAKPEGRRSKPKVLKHLLSKLKKPSERSGDGRAGEHKLIVHSHGEQKGNSQATGVTPAKHVGGAEHIRVQAAAEGDAPPGPLPTTPTFHHFQHDTGHASDWDLMGAASQQGLTHASGDVTFASDARYKTESGHGNSLVSRTRHAADVGPESWSDDAAGDSGMRHRGLTAALGQCSPHATKVRQSTGSQQPSSNSDQKDAAQASAIAEGRSDGWQDHTSHAYGVNAAGSNSHQQLTVPPELTQKIALLQEQVNNLTEAELLDPDTTARLQQVSSTLTGRTLASSKGHSTLLPTPNGLGASHSVGKKPDHSLEGLVVFGSAESVSTAATVLQQQQAVNGWSAPSVRLGGDAEGAPRWPLSSPRQHGQPTTKLGAILSKQAQEHGAAGDCVELGVQHTTASAPALDLGVPGLHTYAHSQGGSPGRVLGRTSGGSSMGRVQHKEPDTALLLAPQQFMLAHHTQAQAQAASAPRSASAGQEVLGTRTSSMGTATLAAELNALSEIHYTAPGRAFSGSIGSSNQRLGGIEEEGSRQLHHPLGSGEPWRSQQEAAMQVVGSQQEHGIHPIYLEGAMSSLHRTSRALGAPLQYGAPPAMSAVPSEPKSLPDLIPSLPPDAGLTELSPTTVSAGQALGMEAGAQHWSTKQGPAGVGWSDYQSRHPAQLTSGGVSPPPSLPYLQPAAQVSPSRRAATGARSRDASASQVHPGSKAQASVSNSQLVTALEGYRARVASRDRSAAAAGAGAWGYTDAEFRRVEGAPWPAANAAVTGSGVRSAPLTQGVQLNAEETTRPSGSRLPHARSAHAQESHMESARLAPAMGDPLAHVPYQTTPQGAPHNRPVPKLDGAGPACYDGTTLRPAGTAAAHPYSQAAAPSWSDPSSNRPLWAPMGQTYASVHMDPAMSQLLKSFAELGFDVSNAQVLQRIQELLTQLPTEVPPGGLPSPQTTQLERLQQALIPDQAQASTMPGWRGEHLTDTAAYDMRSTQQVSVPPPAAVAEQQAPGGSAYDGYPGVQSMSPMPAPASYGAAPDSVIYDLLSKQQQHAPLGLAGQPSGLPPHMHMQQQQQQGRERQHMMFCSTETSWGLGSGASLGYPSSAGSERPDSMGPGTQGGRLGTFPLLREDSAMRRRMQGRPPAAPAAAAAGAAAPTAPRGRLPRARSQGQLHNAAQQASTAAAAGARSSLDSISAASLSFRGPRQPGRAPPARPAHRLSEVSGHVTGPRAPAPAPAAATASSQAVAVRNHVLLAAGIVLVVVNLLVTWALLTYATGGERVK